MRRNSQLMKYSVGPTGVMQSDPSLEVHISNRTVVL